MLNAEDHRRIETAIAAAEQGTTGDVFCVLAGEVSSYREAPIAWGAAAALLVPPIVLAFGLKPLLEAVTGGGWTIAQPGAEDAELGLVLTGYAVAQIILFAVVALIASIPTVRRAVTPGFLKRHRVKQAALHHFVATHAHAQESEPAVLIFVALVERDVEVLADAAIHAKVGDEVWRKAAAAVQQGMQAPDPTAGIEQAIALCGAALKAHFPADGPRAIVDKPMDA